MPGDRQGKAIIVFDGVCVLCSGWVRFLIKRDPDRFLQFTTMQSDAGRKLLKQAALDPDDPSSFVLAQGGHILRQSDAIAAVLKTLRGPWPVAASIMLLTPRFVRDWLYFRIARNRYKLFGQRDICYAPMPGDRDRFIL